MARFLKNRQKSHGKSPGSLIFIGQQKMEKSRIRVIRYDQEQLKEEELENVNNLDTTLRKGTITWLNIDGLHDTDMMNQLKGMFDISSLVMEDILNTDQRPKLVEDNDKIIIILKVFYFKTEENIFSSEQISFILGENYLITIQERVGDYFESVRNRLRNSIGKVRQSGSDYLCYALLDAVSDSYMSVIEKLGDVIENQEEVILKHTRRDIIGDIYRHKTEISYLRKSIRPVKEIMIQFLKSESNLLHKRTIVYLNDLDDIITQVLEAVETYYTMISDQLTIYHTNISNRVNDVMKVLTVFASIFIPLTFIAGVYGTNFDYLPELHFRYSYFIMWGVMICVAGGMLLYFNRKKWL